MSFAQVSSFPAARVIPILTPSTAAAGVAVSRILFEAGLSVQEITMRNPSGLETIRALRRDLPDVVVGAGSVLTPRSGEDAIQAGARFLVSPGTTEPLLQFAVNCAVPFLPGVGSVSEIMRVQALGCELAKLFPVRALGGIGFLRSVVGPLPSMKFCPTGDIDAEVAADYLALTNVAAVAGSWMAPKELVDQGRYADIHRLAVQAAAL
jgi:2-dehydro-3-deoxyphosphogluconate aldolase/(4S)-4-hydroxy-2-oxoglutarate aldolase